MVFCVGDVEHRDSGSSYFLNDLKKILAKFHQLEESYQVKTYIVQLSNTGVVIVACPPCHPPPP